LLALLAPLVFSSSATGADLSLQTLVEFQSNPKNPRGELVEGSAGNFYGTTTFGGTNGENGTVFQMTPSGTLTLLHSFGGSDGSLPSAGLASGNDGFWYGTAAAGGANGDFGVVFRISTTGDLTVLHSFSGSDGDAPRAALARGNDGNFYGTTAFGGTNGDHGTVFQITPGGIFTSLFSFNGTNGSRPMSRLVQGNDGAFYGTTSEGGSGYGGAIFGGDGTVFRIASGGGFTSLFSFHGNDGSDPEAGMVKGNDGNFYGTTQSGGANGDNGTVFKISPAGSLTTLHSFDGADGNYPLGCLALGSDGNFYGTTAGDNATAFGTIFRIAPGGALTTMFYFNGIRGASPAAGLVLARDGNFYGTAFEGGAGDGGTVFRLVEPVLIGPVSASNGNVRLTWTTFTNGTYRVEYRTELIDPGWTALSADVLATNSSTSITDNPEGGARRFYRIRLLP
jgi:uncharacterized repeat protein (TIGR03803 family)